MLAHSRSRGKTSLSLPCENLAALSLSLSHVNHADTRDSLSLSLIQFFTECIRVGICMHDQFLLSVRDANKQSIELRTALNFFPSISILPLWPFTYSNPLLFLSAFLCVCREDAHTTLLLSSLHYVLIASQICS